MTIFKLFLIFRCPVAFFLSFLTSEINFSFSKKIYAFSKDKKRKPFFVIFLVFFLIPALFFAVILRISLHFYAIFLAYIAFFLDIFFASQCFEVKSIFLHKTEDFFYNLCEKVTTPIFFYAIGGAPFAIFCKAILYSYEKDFLPKRLILGFLKKAQILIFGIFNFLFFKTQLKNFSGGKKQKFLVVLVCTIESFAFSLIPVLIF